MPIVTDIQPQKRKQTYFNIYIDGKYAFSLSDLDVSTAHLRIGQEVDPTTVTNLQHQSQFSKAYNRALDQISRRMRSVGEMTDYLKGKDYTATVVAEVVKKLEALQLLDDAQFARAWVRNRSLLKPRSSRMLRAELTKKHIDRSIIDEALAEYGETGELASLASLIAAKQKNPRYADPQKLTEYLAGQGFSYALVKKALVLSASERQSQSDTNKN